MSWWFHQHLISWWWEWVNILFYSSLMDSYSLLFTCMLLLWRLVMEYTTTSWNGPSYIPVFLWKEGGSFSSLKIAHQHDLSYYPWMYKIYLIYHLCPMGVVIQWFIFCSTLDMTTVAIILIKLWSMTSKIWTLVK